MSSKPKNSKSMFKGRRRFLAAGAITAFGAYSYHRGLRYPRMGYEQRPIDTNIITEQGEFSLSNAIPVNNTFVNNSLVNDSFVNDSVVEQSTELTKSQTSHIGTQSGALAFRAIAPDTGVTINARRGTISFSFNNIAQNAILSVNDTTSGRNSVRKTGIRNIEEQRDGITRLIKIDAATDQTIELQWRLPEEDGYKFAVIGDSGGNLELDWCLTRAVELKAQFLLHLGDFNYGHGDYQRAIQAFHQAPIPCYISIGNHDFNDSGLIYHHYRQNLGEMNNAFTVAGTRFVNFDTAADFFPVSTGMRGRLLNQLSLSPTEHQIFFTHRPLRDPRPGEDHNVGSLNGVEWLSNAINQAGGGALLTGHVHHSAELNINGIHQYTVGEGLGFDDILLQRQVAKIMIGTVSQGHSPELSWEPLNMPWSAHKSHTHLKKLKKRGDQRLLDWYVSLETL